MSKNLYNTLGVAKDASPEEIKKSYRALSLKYHPDRNTDPSATDLYKEINEAYEILSDPQKRQQYDMGGMDFVGHPGGGGPGSDMNDINQFFNMMFGGGGGMPGMGMPFGGGMGDMPEIHIFHGGMGGGRFRQQMMKPQAIQKTVQITLEQLYNGDTIPFEYECWTMQNGMRINELKTIQITIPRGIQENERMVLAQQGNSAGENNTGDLIISFDVQKHNLFDRVGMDLILHKKISLKDALCGFSFDIRHLNDKVLHMNNTTNYSIIRPNYRKHIPNLGIVRNGQTGSLIIEFDIEFPESLTPETTQTLRELL